MVVLRHGREVLHHRTWPMLHSIVFSKLALRTCSSQDLSSTTIGVSTRMRVTSLWETKMSLALEQKLARSSIVGMVSSVGTAVEDRVVADY